MEITSENITTINYRDEMLNYQKALIEVAYRITTDIETARDIVQDTYTSFLESLDSFNGSSSLKTYLYRIVINKSIDCRRRRFRWFGIIDKVKYEITCQNRTQTNENSKKKEILRFALDKIPDSFKIPFLLAEVDEMRYEEIADILKITINTVRTRIYRCKEKLRKELNKAGYR